MDLKTNTFARALLLTACLGMTACSPDRALTSEPGFAAADVEERTDRRSVILFLGDSLTAGYHLDPEQAFPALIQARLDAEGLPYRAVNAGVSGDTTSGGLRRLDWLLVQPVDVFVLALGANDALRGQPVAHIRANLDEIIRRVRAAYPDVRVVLAGMVMPVNYGEVYRSAFESVFTDLAREHDAALIPFLLEGVAGVPELNLRDGIHPTEEGHRVIAETVWLHLAPLVR